MPPPLARPISYHEVYHFSEDPSWEALIFCFSGPQMQVGQIWFANDGTALPANQQTANGIIVLHYYISRFNDVITTLREESPLYLTWDAVNKRGYVSSSERGYE
jgi:hypothetical protein